MQHSTVTDAERLVLIMTGGISNIGGWTEFNDVWQLSFQTTLSPANLWYRLTATPGFSPRRSAALYAVHDWLFLYGGATTLSMTVNGGNVDDVWQSPDYGSTWMQASTAGTGVARHGVAGLSVSRRLFVVGGSTGDDYLTQGFANDVWVAYW